jgi:hypothetical protein
MQIRILGFTSGASLISLKIGGFSSISAQVLAPPPLVINPLFAIILPLKIREQHCRYAYGDTQPAASLEGSVAYNQDTIENPKGGKLWLMPTVATIEYVVHEF